MEERSYKKKEQSYKLRAICYRLIFILLSITIGSSYSIKSAWGDGNNVIGTDFWELTGKLSSSSNNALSISVASNGDIWAITYDGKTSLSAVYLSTNNGYTWVEKNNGLQENQIHSITINPVNGYLFMNSSMGLFRSTDRGKSWVKVTSDMVIRDILVTASGEIYLVMYAKIYYSSDNGNTWIEKNNDGLPSGCYILSLVLGKDGTLYAGTYSKGVCRSTDGGDTWLLSTNYTKEFVDDLTISDDGSIFATTWNNDVLKSTDNRGVTWTKVHTSLVDGFANRIIYNPITKDIFLTQGLYDSKVYRSTNLGASWELINNGIPEATSIRGFAFNHNTGQMYVATSDGLYRSKNYP